MAYKKEKNEPKKKERKCKSCGDIFTKGSSDKCLRCINYDSEFT